MRTGYVVFGLLALVFSLAFFAVPNGVICGAPLIILAFILLIYGLATSPPAPAPPPQPIYVMPQPVYYPPPYPPPAPPPVVQQREVVTREVVKVRCRYCGALVDEGVNTCPRCQAPMR